MNTIFKKIVARTYKPVLEKYLSKKRIYRYGDTRLEIPPEVFHPGFFSSTQLLLQYITKLSLKGKKFLELGAGSGLISMVATNKGANVLATDVNPVAIEYLHINSKQNNVKFEIIHSDLFNTIPEQQFDVIAINPPYYKKEPQTLLDHAWFCGEKGEYFFKLFQQLSGYIHNNSDVILVACDGCDINMIAEAASGNAFKLDCVLTRQTILEKNFIFKIVPGTPYGEKIN